MVISNISLRNMQLAYLSHPDMCVQLMNLTSVTQSLCGQGLHFMVDMEFPPQFSITIPETVVAGFTIPSPGTFDTAALQNLTHGLLGITLPRLNIPLVLPAAASMSSLRPKLSLDAIMTMAQSLGQNQTISDFRIGKNPAGGDIVTIHFSDGSFVMDASTSGFFPGFDVDLTINLTGYAKSLANTGYATGRRQLDERPFWPQRRHLQTVLSGPVPEVVKVNVVMLTGMKTCGPFAELDVKIQPAITWVSPFGIANLNLSLQALGGGLCMSGLPVPVPSRFGLVGGFNWNSVLSGMIFIELQMSATATQFFYGELRCSLEPCDAYNLLREMGVEGLSGSSFLKKVMQGMSVDCNNPTCRMWLVSNCTATICLF